MTGETFNVFHRKRNPTMCCAVRQSQPVPSFIQGEIWDFDGTVSDPVSAPLGFQFEAASEAALLLGYYLFQRFSGASEGMHLPSGPVMQRVFHVEQSLVSA
ncbi:hypothetical protein [Methylobacterium planeticum]|uniref:hypothetical protein n=1 Tax=Methylobacterium planeticum TaxID=2615211 RepID=UPI0017875FF4|nr:hypothetical protein [Methylobacterium planeticum]